MANPFFQRKSAPKRKPAGRSYEPMDAQGTDDVPSWIEQAQSHRSKKHARHQAPMHEPAHGDQGGMETCPYCGQPMPHHGGNGGGY